MDIQHPLRSDASGLRDDEDAHTVIQRRLGTGGGRGRGLRLKESFGSGENILQGSRHRQTDASAPELPGASRRQQRERPLRKPCIETKCRGSCLSTGVDTGTVSASKNCGSGPGGAVEEKIKTTIQFFLRSVPLSSSLHTGWKPLEATARASLATCSTPLNSPRHHPL